MESDLSSSSSVGHPDSGVASDSEWTLVQKRGRHQGPMQVQSNHLVQLEIVHDPRDSDIIGAFSDTTFQSYLLRGPSVNDI